VGSLGSAGAFYSCDLAGAGLFTARIRWCDWSHLLARVRSASHFISPGGVPQSSDKTRDGRCCTAAALVLCKWGRRNALSHDVVQRRCDPHAAHSLRSGRHRGRFGSSGHIALKIRATDRDAGWEFLAACDGGHS